jgi:hypothetical protein
MSTASNWANTLLGARGSRQDSWQEEVVADRSYRVRKGRAACAHLCLGPRVCLCAREWLVVPFVAAARCPPAWPPTSMVTGCADSRSSRSC